ncbi:MAG: metallophosphoesterase [Candidatus Cloacimonetes bacterium]|nr:metallophosphoesterase [Candidatus Cloacimonadota bacterium]
MKHRYNKANIITFFSTLLLIILFFSCSETTKPDGLLTVSFPTLHNKHDLYYELNHMVRSIEMLFSEEIDESTIQGNVDFSDVTGSLNAHYDIDVFGKIVTLQFHPEFYLRAGWKYILTLKTGLHSSKGESFEKTQDIQFRTTGETIDLVANADSLQRTSIVCISDVHMGDERAIDGGYCWFDENADALENFLDYVMNSPDVKQLVILGDLFDEWLVPYEVAPFDSSINIHNSKDYFQAIANCPTNVEIFNKFRTIVNNGEIELIYVPGNHDMLLTQEILDGIIPNITWMGDVPGLGKYAPANEIIMEHGHRYDLFNCPQSLVNPSHKLPPGYFISRLYAQGMTIQPPNNLMESANQKGSFEFFTGWTLAFLTVLSDFDMACPPLYDEIIKMNGIDSYFEPFSFNGAYEMYADSIESLWQETQAVNEVPVPMSTAMGIFDGVELSGAPIYEYIINPSTKPYKIIAFGHSHKPHIMVYPTQSNYTSIYANSGSWVDAEYCTHDVRTFLVITPGEWSGSELDVVMLYRFDPVTGTSKTDYKLILLAEESIEVD